MKLVCIYAEPRFTRTFSLIVGEIYEGEYFLNENREEDVQCYWCITAIDIQGKVRHMVFRKETFILLSEYREKKLIIY